MLQGYTRNMFELEVRRSFSAAHAIMMQGKREALHGHDWGVDLIVSSPGLDSDELACDFHALESALDAVIAPFRSQNLNETRPFDTVNPTAEAVARHIAKAMLERLPSGVALVSVKVTEAPGCSARYVTSPRGS